MRRGAWLLLALAACGEGGSSEKAPETAAARADSAPALTTVQPIAPPEVPFAEAPAAARGRFASAVQKLPVAPPAGSARFCHWGENGAAFGMILKTGDGYAVELYREAGPPGPGVYPLKAQNPNLQQFSTYDGFYLSDASGAAVPLAVLGEGEVAVDSAGPEGVIGTLRLRLRTHAHTGGEPASQGAGGYDPRETVGTLTTAFRAVEGGLCDTIHDEMMADTPVGLRARPAT